MAQAINGGNSQTGGFSPMYKLVLYSIAFGAFMGVAEALASNVASPPSLTDRVEELEGQVETYQTLFDALCSNLDETASNAVLSVCRLYTQLTG